MCLLTVALAKEEIPLNPAALSAILIVLLLLVFLCVGMNALSSIKGPAAFTPTPLIIGKEK